MAIYIRTLLSLLVAFGLGVTTASAQTTAVCSNTPATGERIRCEDDATSTNNIDSDTANVTISTAADGEDGIDVTHLGSGDVDIDIQGGSIETRGGYSYGVYGRLSKADHGGMISIRTGGGSR